MATPVSAVFAAQQAAQANQVRGKALLWYGDYAWNAGGASTSVQHPDAFNTPSVFDSDVYSGSNIGEGNRSHRNFSDQDGTGERVGWKGSVAAVDATGVLPCVPLRNVDSPSDGHPNNNSGTISLAQRSISPTGPFANTKLRQLALRVGQVTGAPGGLVVEIWTDVAGLPGALLSGAGTINVRDIDAGGIAYLQIPVPIAIAPGTYYWIVAKFQTSGVDYFALEQANGTGTIAFPNDEFAAIDPGGGAWAAQAFRFHYRAGWIWDASVNGEVMTIDMGAERLLNRMRLYSFPSNRSVQGQGIKVFTVEQSVDNVTYTAWNPTSGRASDYANPGLAPTIAGNQVTLAAATSVELAFADTSVRYVRLTITAVQLRTPVLRDAAGTAILNHQFAQLIAAELYFAADITDRVTELHVGIHRDTLLVTDQARTCTLGVSNVDRYFSPLYAPRADQVAAGFRNSELRPNLELQIFSGFGTPEQVSLGVFFIDKLLVNPRDRAATIQARDYSKRFENQILGLQSAFNIRLEDAIELVANEANFSSSWYVPAQTEDNLLLYAPAGTTGRQELDLLTEAAPFGTVRIDESGMLRFLTFHPTSGTYLLGDSAQISPAPFGSKFYIDFTSAEFRSHLIVSGDKAYIGCIKAVVGGAPPQFQALIEIDLPTRTIREIWTLANAGVPNLPANLALDGAGNIFFGVDATLYRVNLTTLVAATIGSGTLPAFQQLSNQCDSGVVRTNAYYFAWEDNVGGVHLATVDTGLTVVVDLGLLMAGSTQVGRMVRWTPPVGGFDRIYFMFHGGAPTNTYYDFGGGGLATDAVTRRMVTTDTTVLYEAIDPGGPTLLVKSRTGLGVVTSLFGVPVSAGGPPGAPPGLAYLGGMLFAEWSTAAHNNAFRVYNLLDGSSDDIDMPERVDRAILTDDPANGRAAFVGSMMAGLFGGFAVNYLRVFQASNAPVASDFSLSWNETLLDASYEMADHQGGQSTVYTRLRFIFTPQVLGEAVHVWTDAPGGAPIGGDNPRVLSFSPLDFVLFGHPRFSSALPRVGRFVVPVSTDFEGFVCLTATGVQTFGPAVSNSAPPSALQPQIVEWQGVPASSPLTATLYPHPTAPRLVLDPLGSTCILTDLHITARPITRGGLSEIEVVSEDVLADGALVHLQNGDNVKEVQNQYINDGGVLILAAKQVLRVYGHPQTQVRGIRTRFLPQAGLEDVTTVVEPESGINARLIVVGLDHEVKGGLSSGSAETSITALLLPVASQAGLGQPWNPTPTAVGPFSA